MTLSANGLDLGALTPVHHARHERHGLLLTLGLDSFVSSVSFVRLLFRGFSFLFVFL
jgi:hypothetical protein